MIVDGSPSKPQLVGDKELEILIMTNIATLKRKIKKYRSQKVFQLVKDSLENNLTKENLNECFGRLTSNKTVKHNKINSRGC